jgi:hypothetical protein
VKKSLLIIVLAIVSLSIRGQRPGYDISFYQIFDNREYFSEYAFPQTIFGARLDASLLFRIDTMHRFAAGFNYLYEHGSSALSVPPQVNLYYAYHSNHLEMALGSFPRRDRIDMPLVFLTDTLNYFRPNIEGAHLAYVSSFFEVYGFLDWTGRVSVNTRESFLAGLDASFMFEGFFLNPSYIMYHQARSYDRINADPIRDNGIFSIMTGYKSEKKNTPLSLEVSSGYIFSYDRLRPAEPEWGRGWLTNIDLRYTIFGFKGVYYFGTPVNFEYGDPFYKSGNYGRLDFFTDPFSIENVDSKIGWNVHIVPGEGLHHSQQLLMRVRF